jgi:uncharacterized protein (TIGR02145 family)
MKKNFKIALIIGIMIINQQAFSQKENAKSPLRGEQQIELSEGYSFVSSRIIAENPDMLAVMATVLNENLDFIRNSQGAVLRKIGPNWINGIGDWIIEEGYLVKMFANDSFIMDGDVVDPVTPIQLEAGFQFVSYFPETPMDALIAYETILGDELDFIRNSQGQILRKIGPNWVNGIGDCNPGEGYLVKMFDAAELIYPGSSSFTCGDPFTDPRDGQVYTTVQIADQCWMAENLNIGSMINGNEEMTDNSIIEKYCYNNDLANCETFGGLYQWHEIMQYTTTPGVQGICPSGWHIPIDGEWKILEGIVDSQYPVGDTEWDGTDWRGYDAGLNLKSTSGWYNNGNGTDLFGFTALPSGLRVGMGYFYWLNSYAFFWSSSDFGDLSAWYRRLDYCYGNVLRAGSSKTTGFSVRCLNNEYNVPPVPPSTPYPEDGAENQSIENYLSWICIDLEGDPLTYDIYFGTETTPPQVVTAQTETIYNPGILETETEYFWKIVAHDDHENTTLGPVWSFTTQSEGGCPASFTYQGQVYEAVLIGNQCWMAENLNIGEMISSGSNMTNNSLIEKYCYNNDSANCETYGGLYQWNEMMQYITTPGVQGICPSGWHLPMDGDWTIVTDFLGGVSVAGGKMKEAGTTHWEPPNTGATNESGFTALPGGYLNSNGYFNNLGFFGYWWSSTQNSSSNAWQRYMFYFFGEVGIYNANKIEGFSVRCVRD